MNRLQRRRLWQRERRLQNGELEARVKRRFAHVISTMNLHDIISLLDYKKTLARVAMYCPETKTTYAPSNLPWPVLWLVGRYNPKHILQRSREPRIASLLADVDTIVNKIHWRWALKDDQIISSKYRVRSKATPRCYEQFPPAMLAHWMSLFKKEIGQSIENACKRANALPYRGNCSELHRIAVRHFAYHKLAVVKNDKDGGMSLVPLAKLRTSMMATLQSNAYYYCGPAQLCKGHGV